jgi:Helicase associated domain
MSAKDVQQNDAWEKGLAVLKQFKRREGHCLVPRHHIEGVYRLGQWVSVQRYYRDTITPLRRGRLNEIGFVWDTRDLRWEKGFAALKKFKVREKHCRVPYDHTENTVKLGWWVITQRRRKGRLLAERKKRLSKIGFVW